MISFILNEVLFSAEVLVFGKTKSVGVLSFGFILYDSVSEEKRSEFTQKRN